MDLIRTRDEENAKTEFTLILTDRDLNQARLSEIDRRMIDWFSKQEDIESQLMLLQIYVRNIMY